MGRGRGGREATPVRMSIYFLCDHYILLDQPASCVPNSVLILTIQILTQCPQVKEGYLLHHGLSLQPLMSVVTFLVYTSASWVTCGKCYSCVSRISENSGSPPHQYGP